MSARTTSPTMDVACHAAAKPGWRRVSAVLIVGIALALAACGSSSTGPGGSATATPTIAPAATPTPAPSRVWRLIQGAVTSPPASDLQATVALSPTDAWAVGETFVDPQDIQERSLIERWDGTSWHTVPNPGYDFLNAVAAVSTNDVWAVGGSINYGVGYHPDKPLIMHWNGTKWVKVPSPDTHALAVELTGVAALATNDVWAVGKMDVDGQVTRPLTEHWNGSAWQIVANPLSKNTRWSSLQTIAAIPDTRQFWAVGSVQPLANSDHERALIERWDGSAWQIVSTSAPPTGSVGSSLSGVVALSATDAWTVGSLVMHWDGTTWHVVTTPDLGLGLSSVAAANANDVRAVGVSGNNAKQTAFILQWDGSAWHQITPPTPSGAHFTTLTSVTTDGSGAFWAVGSAHTTGPGSTWGDARTLLVSCP